MSTSIAFTDGTGSATLTSDSQLLPPHDRFWAWTPLSPTTETEAASEVVSLTGVTHQWAYRSDYGASFELRRIAEGSLAIADRLIRHLKTGNTVTVNTGDLDSATYTCRLMPGSTPQRTLADEAMRWYTLALSLKNGSAAAMTVRYG
jgi:hypothetical protein